MCGVVGYLDQTGQPVSADVLSRMLERIRYRGPDDQGTWVDGPIGLGHCRLSILDLSPRGHQPFVTADGQGVLTYNGEVYNFRELRAELEQEGVRFTSTSDTEVVLYALHRWGPERAVPRFNGMFALAYYDRRTQTLWLSRDRVGIKPLYLARTSHGVVFASEMKALLTHPEVPCRADLHALTAHILTWRLEGEWTPFEGIEAIRPGTLLKVTTRGIERSTYFDVLRDLDLSRLVEGGAFEPQHVVATFDELFSQSVRMHLLSDAPLAVMCSGGVDSSLLTAVAKADKTDIVGYVADIQDLVSEGAKAKRVGKHLGVEIRQIDVAPVDYARLWPAAVWHSDQPTFQANEVPFLVVAQAMRRDGFKVALTGEGSDELFGGYDWQRATHHTWRRRRWHARFIPNRPFWRRLGRVIPQVEPFDLRTLGTFPFTNRVKLNNPEMLLREACATDGGQRLVRQASLFQKLDAVQPVEDRAFLARCFDDFISHLQTVLHRNDRMAMAASVESRVPFLENALIEFGIHLPRRAKYQQGVAKWVVKQAAQQRLPHDIVHAPKLGFPVSPEPWRNSLGLIAEGGMVPELFKWDARARLVLLERIRQTPSVSMTLVGIELWARMFLRGESPEELGERLAAMSRNVTAVSSRPTQVPAASLQMAWR